MHESCCAWTVARLCLPLHNRRVIEAARLRSERVTKNAANAKSKTVSRGKVAARVANARSRTPARVKPGNPLLVRWSAAFGLPPFKKIEPEHFKAAFAAALKEHKAEIARIAGE